MSPTALTRSLFALTGFVVLLGLATNLDGYALLDPDEGRNAEIAREMAASNDYLVPRLNGLPYADKPVLFFAATAAALELFGRQAWVVRLPSLLFTLATLGVVFLFARHLWGSRHAAFAAAVATGTMPLTLAFARTVIFDATLTFFVVAAVAAFHVAIEWPTDHPGRDRSRWTILAWCALALGVLTKGPIALGLPLFIALPYALWRRRAAALVDTVGLLAFVAIILPWVRVMSDATPGFLRYVFVTETALRFATDELQRTEPVWYFVPILLAGAMPWSLPVAAAAVRRLPSLRRTPLDPRIVFLAIWIVVPLLFFSLSQSKRPQYVLPLLPAFGLLAAHLWQRRDGTAFRIGGVLLSLAGAVLLAAPLLVPRLLDLDPAVAAAIPVTALILGAVTLAAGTSVAVVPRRPGVVLLAFAVPVASIPFASRDLMRAVGEDRSTRALAVAIDPHLQDDTEIVAVKTYPLSLPFYLDRTLTVSTATGRELTSNYLERTYSRWTGPGSPLKPLDWWYDAAVSCVRPTVFVAAADSPESAMLEPLLPRLGATRKYAAFGPCVASNLASHPD